MLQRLGLPSGAVRNVMMPKDIVPRAFACDYTLVRLQPAAWYPRSRSVQCFLFQGQPWILFRSHVAALGVEKQIVSMPFISKTMGGIIRVTILRLPVGAQRLEASHRVRRMCTI